MPRPYPFAAWVDGRRYTGDWSLMQGGRICVRSLGGFGSEIAELGQARPETVAAQTLERIVRADQARRAEFAARQAKALAELRRPRRRPRREHPDGL